jgi:adenylate kinase family enzyme
MGLRYSSAWGDLMNVIDIDEAARLLPGVNRVLVIGCSGSGKSTLSSKLATRFGLRHISMDKEFFWLPGWEARDRAEIARLITAAVAEDRWVMDGTNPSTMPIRLPRTELVIWMRPSRWVSILGVYRRTLRLRGTVRPEMADGCVERLPDREFLSYIWNFERKHAPAVLDMLARHGPQVPVLQLKSHKETAPLLALLPDRH